MTPGGPVHQGPIVLPVIDGHGDEPEVGRQIGEARRVTYAFADVA